MFCGFVSSVTLVCSLFITSEEESTLRILTVLLFGDNPEVKT
jgi:hypothetical protein